MGVLPSFGKMWSSSERHVSSAWLRDTLVFLTSSQLAAILWSVLVLIIWNLVDF